MSFLSRYTSLTSLGFTVQWICAILVAHLCLLYEDTRMRYPLLSFSSTLLVTEESGGCIGSSPLSVANQNRKTHGRHSHYTHETRTRIYKQTPRRTKPPTSRMADIRGAWYDGGFKIPPGGVAYPSRPGGDARLSQLPTLLGGDDSNIRKEFPSWNRSCSSKHEREKFIAVVYT